MSVCCQCSIYITKEKDKIVFKNEITFFAPTLTYLFFFTFANRDMLPLDVEQWI